MKYRRLLFVPMAALLFLLSACAGTGPVEQNPVDSVTYLPMHAEWPRYETTQELVAAGADILIGTVTDISYQMLDMKTAEPPTEKSEKLDCMLHTIYHVKVAKMYKGRVYDTVKVRMMGGQEGVRVEEQLKALGEDAARGIPVMGGMPDIQMGKSYLFVLYRYKADMPSILSPYQGVYELTDTEKTAAPGEIPTLKDIITYFGPEAWNEFQKLLPNLR